MEDVATVKVAFQEKTLGIMQLATLLYSAARIAAAVNRLSRSAPYLVPGHCNKPAARG